MVSNITIDNLSFGYKGREPVFSDVSLEYKAPKVLCILGPNGVGKSTLLKCIAGQLFFTAGNILINGEPLASISVKALAGIIAYIPQLHTPTFPFLVLDVVTMGSACRVSAFSCPGVKEREIALKNLDFLNIAHLAGRPYTEISGGERQLVMLACALTQQPEIMLLDEPTAHLDFGNQHRFLDIVLKLKDSGIGVIMTTHFPSHALAVADEVFVLSERRIFAHGTPDSIITQQNIEKLYGIPVEIIEIQGGKMCVPGALHDPKLNFN